MEQRRFTLRHLRDFGFGKKSLEGIILDEAEVLIKKLQNNNIQVRSIFDSLGEIAIRGNRKHIWER
jgi:hypothetical protein